MRQELKSDNQFEARFFFTDSTTSTMDEIKELLLEHPESLALALRADEQTKGKGRRNATAWSSPPGGGIYCTLAIRKDTWDYLWRKEQGIQNPVPLLGMKVALGLAQSLSHYSSNIQVKWPNDVLANGKKIVGILAEVWKQYYLIGFGINLLKDAYLDSYSDISFRAISLEEISTEEQMESIRNQGLNEMTSFFLNNLHAAFIDLDWNKKLNEMLFGLNRSFEFTNIKIDSAFTSSVINTELNNQNISATILGLDEHGLLIIDCDGIKIHIRDGHFNPY